MVDRCVCFRVSFERLATSGVDTLDGIQHKFSCGLRCGLCTPYIRLILETGRTTFQAGEPEEARVICVDMER